MKTLILTLVAALFAGVIWRTRGPQPAAKPPSYSHSRLVDGNNRFALDLYRRLAGQKGDIFFSPESISTALAMTYAGARGQTAEQIAKTLYFDQSVEQLNAGFAAILRQLNAGGTDRVYQFSIANRLWGQQGYEFLDDFLKVTREDYGAELAEVDFLRKSDAARQAINSWVEKQTHDKIKELIADGGVGPMTRLVLTNAIYFKGDWQTPFDRGATRKALFHVAANKNAVVMMMNQEGSYRFANVEGIQLLEMVYHGGELAMDVLLPEKFDGLPDLENSLSVEKLNGWIAGLQDTRVAVAMPKLKTTCTFDLSETLAAMGMPLAFSDGADFSGISGKPDLFISAVIHKAFVDVDEKGTEAAAATGVAVSLCSASVEEPKRFIADHPFIFLIRDIRSGSILFLGRYTGPTEGIN
jgi:serpin B